MPVVASVIESIKSNEIDCLILDPMVSFHSVDENSNSKIQRVVTQFAYVAKETNASVELIAHTRKTNGQEVTADSTRGASALHDKARSLRTINRMTIDEGEKAGLAKNEYKSIIRIDHGKTSMMPPGAGSTWRRLVSRELGNGDSVGVVDAWAWPNVADNAIEPTEDQIVEIRTMLVGNVGREDAQAKQWAGYAVMDVLGLDRADKSKRAAAQYALDGIIATGRLKVQTAKDAHFKDRKFIVAA
jgi:hypothetical protein